MKSNEAREFLKQPYTRVLIPDEESGTFTAQIMEFPGCLAQGATPAEAYERLESAAASWIEAALQMRQEIPRPTSDVQFSGRFALRLPRSLHGQAAKLADLEQTSLNQFIVSAIAEKVGALNLYHILSRQLQATVTSVVINNAQSAQTRMSIPRALPSTAKQLMPSSQLGPALQKVN